MAGWEQKIQAGPLLLDGAMGTMLMAEGLTGGDCPESYNLTHPRVLAGIARKYRLAGCDIVQTNTFGASPIKLAKYRLDDRIDTIITAAVRMAREGADGKTLVCGSCGPCGDLLRPYGQREPGEVLDGFRVQMALLAREEVDLLHIETMSDLREAVLALQAAREISPQIPVLVSLTFNPSPRGFFTLMGDDIPTVIRTLTEKGAQGIGSNCGNGSDQMVSIAREIRKHSTLPIVIQPNAGLPRLQSGRTVYPETPGYMARKAREMLKAGVNILGGCCGTTPAHMSAIAKVIDEY